ncbi:MAG: class I SAM-dependent methyltransferase [Defluviitaleaceae bacterium]|nr:class I SAM-dependent methyltransferase [Defluviitaleaceae bacterium]
MNKFNEKNIKAYDKKADNYDNTHDGKFTEKFKTLLLNTVSVKDGDSVLDVGCGNGTLLSRIATLKSIQGFGTDISSQMIKNATSRYSKLRFVVSDCEKIPFDDNSMDIITVCAAYHHFPNVNAFAAEAKRLLKASGSLYIAEVYLPLGIRQVANIFLPLLKDGDVKFYTSKEIVNTFSSFGFRLINTMAKGHIQIVHLQKG